MVSRIGMKLSSSTNTTSAQMVIVMLLTAKTGPHRGSYSGLYAHDPRERHFSMDE